MTPEDLYLDLMKKSLLNLLFADLEQPVSSVTHPTRSTLGQARMDGSEWPVEIPTYTLIGMKRLENLQFCIEDVLNNNVPGDLIEAGVWRGGATIFMRAVLKAHNILDRTVWVADSFQGLPPPDVTNYPQDEGYDLSSIKELSVSVEEVKANFARYGLLDLQVQFLPGWFHQTLSIVPINQLAILRIDGDLYQSTIESLQALYAKLSPGGYLIIDDYGALLPCRQAVNDFRRIHRIDDPIVAIDWTGIYWQKSMGSCL